MGGGGGSPQVVKGAVVTLVHVANCSQACWTLFGACHTLAVPVCLAVTHIFVHSFHSEHDMNGRQT